jgi:hypothetical protein
MPLPFAPAMPPSRWLGGMAFALTLRTLKPIKRNREGVSEEGQCYLHRLNPCQIRHAYRQAGI